MYIHIPHDMSEMRAVNAKTSRILKHLCRTENDESLRSYSGAGHTPAPLDWTRYSM
jgi:hypothetical protein